MLHVCSMDMDISMMAKCRTEATALCCQHIFPSLCTDDTLTLSSPETQSDVKAERIVTPAESPDSELQHITKAVMSRQAPGLPVAVSKVETLWSLMSLCAGFHLCAVGFVSIPKY